jgi:hypothetical protein
VPTPPLAPRLDELLNEYLARRVTEIRFWRTHARGGATEANQFRVTHFAETFSNLFDLERVESYGAHVSLTLVATT